MKRIIIVALALVLITLWIKSMYRNVDDIKSHGTEIAESQGMILKSYQGFQTSPIAGGYVWFTATLKSDTTVLLEYAVQKWFGEYHIYELSVKNAVKGN